MRLVRTFTVCVLTLGLCAAVASASAPYRGVDTWYALGTSVNERSVGTLAHAMVDRGLARSGYRLLWLDAGWWTGRRTAAGHIALDHRRWPHGLTWLVRRLHQLGLRMGIYMDLGRVGCGNGGSAGHLAGDLQQFTAWGFDAIKADFCGAIAEHRHPGPAYATLARAMTALPRHLLLAVSDAAMPARHGAYPAVADSALDAWRWAPAAAVSWRTGPDLGGPGRVRPADVMRNIGLDAAHDGARPGHFADPDYLTPDAGLPTATVRAQIDMWAMLSAPLMLSARVDALPDAVLAQLRDPLTLALDAAAPGALVAEDGSVQTWRKTLTDGRVVTVRLNTGAEAADGIPAYGDLLSVSG